MPNNDVLNIDQTNQTLTKDDIIRKMDPKTLSKMIFIYNAVNNGWKVGKSNDLFIFRKKHENKEAVYTDTYLEQFISESLTFSNLL